MLYVDEVSLREILGNNLLVLKPKVPVKTIFTPEVNSPKMRRGTL